ncbi:hypothetical protein [Micromonospora zhanjiangensis]
MTLFGWDTSDYDVGRGLTRARVTDAAGLGITFLTCKGTEQSPSAVFRSQHCGWILATARDARIPFLGMYVVVRSGVPAATQAGTLVSYANSQVPWWSAFPGFFWQVDLERWPYDQVSPSVGVQVANELEARTAKTALMYASKGQYGTSPLGDFPGGTPTIRTTWTRTSRRPTNGPAATPGPAGRRTAARSPCPGSGSTPAPRGSGRSGPATPTPSVAPPPTSPP